MKIKEVDWGIANNFGDTIEIHKDLKYFPFLYASIVNHELKHTDRLWTWDEFKMDVIPDKTLNLFHLYKFMIKRPKTWIQLLPFYYQKDKGFVYDLNAIIIWFMMSVFLGLGIKYLWGLL